MSVVAFLIQDHRRCDALLEQAQEAVQTRHWGVIATALERFADALALHLACEEELLFPTMEERAGGPLAPARMMSTEHAVMHELVRGLREAVRDRDADEFEALAQTLAIMIQQHNLKEERVLYPMAMQLLGGDAPLLESRLREFTRAHDEAAQIRTARSEAAQIE